MNSIFTKLFDFCPVLSLSLSFFSGNSYKLKEKMDEQAVKIDAKIEQQSTNLNEIKKTIEGRNEQTNSQNG